MIRAAATAGSVATAGAIAGDVAATARGSGASMIALGGLALLALALAVRRAGLIPPALVLLGAAYAIALHERGDTIDGRAILLAPAFLLVAELAYWALEPQAVRTGREVVVPRLATLAGGLTAAALLAAFLVGTSAIDVPATAALLGAGVLAATGALALSARLARRG